MNTLRIEKVTYDGTERKQLVGACKLVSLPNGADQKYTNARGETKSFKFCNAKGLLPNGKEIDLLCTVPEKNLERMKENNGEFKVGESYLTTITAEPSNTDPTKLVFFARMSHLQGTGTDNNSLMEAFGADFGLTGAFMEPKLAENPVEDNLVEEVVI